MHWKNRPARISVLSVALWLPVTAASLVGCITEEEQPQNTDQLQALLDDGDLGELHTGALTVAAAPDAAAPGTGGAGGSIAPPPEPGPGGSPGTGGVPVGG